MEEPDDLKPLANASHSVDAFTEFRRVLTAGTNIVKPSKNDHRPWLTILALGDLACDLQSEDEDIECVALGNIRKELFMEIAWERIIEAQTNDVTLRPYAVSEDQIVLELRGITFDMQYVECRELINEYPGVIDVPIGYQLHLPDDVNDIINQLRDLERFRAGSKKFSVQSYCWELTKGANYAEDAAPFSFFPRLHRFIRTWTKAVGLFGLGALNQNALRELSWKIAAEATTAVSISAEETSSQERGLSRILRPFLKTHARCFDPVHVKPGRDCSLGSQLNITENCAKTLHEELARLCRVRGCADADVLRKDILSLPVTDHMIQEEAIRLSVCYSGNSEVDGYRIMTFMDSMFLKLIQALESAQDQLHGLHFRVWPTRLVEASNSPASGRNEPYEGCWVIGICGCLDKPREDTIKQILSTWEQRIRIVPRYPASSMTIFAGLTTGSELSLGNLKVDTREWERPLAYPDPALRLDGGIHEQRAGISREQDSAHPPQANMATGPTKKLRPAMEVLSRLRWDYGFSVDDFAVVYKDRHNGLLEKPVKDWATDTTAADWIPQDRIWFFKRISDGVMVWDRAARKDLVNE